jgi:hypothetical protein
MAYINRRAAQKRSTFSAEFMYLLVVLAAGVATAYWAGHKLGMDLSAVTTVASVLGLTETTGVTRPVGYSSTQTAAEPGQAAPYCNPGQTPAFAGGMLALEQRVGAAMGAPVECEHAVSAVGDTVQQTTAGLAAYYNLTNTSTFTDGWHHWAVTPSGYVTWEGTESQPPAASGPGAG